MTKKIIINGNILDLSYEQLLGMVSNLLFCWSKKRAGRYFYSNKDDVLQISRLTLWQCYNKYNIEKGIDMIIFAYRDIAKQLNKWRKKQKVIEENEILDEDIEENIEPEQNTQDIDINIDIKQLLSSTEIMHLDAITHKISIQQYCKEENLNYQKTIKEIKNLKGRLENYVKSGK